MKFKFASFIILISFSLLIWFSHLSNFTCTSSANLPICMPQYVFQFKDDTPTSKVLFSTVKEFFSLLSFFTLDFNWDIDLSELKERYNQSNLIYIFHPTNTYYVNVFGYCKQQTHDKKLNRYCIDNTDGLNIISVLIHDLGFQFGVLSETNVKITGDSFWIIYQTLISSFNKFLEDGKRGNTLFKMITPNDQTELERWKQRLWLMNVYDTVNAILKWAVVTNCILASLCLMLVLFWIWIQIEHKNSQSPNKQLNWNIKYICTITRWMSFCNAAITFVYIFHILMLALMINCFRYKSLQIIHASLGTGAWFHIARFVVELVFAVLCFKWMAPHISASPSSVSETQSTAVGDGEDEDEDEEKETEDNYSVLNHASGTTAVDAFQTNV
ncbi:unnamed protein product [Kluyveromyces dobzhanskii CBS 2104]|uniref:WGS project CCBQ000000000 data, contig 00016 n=1 Tax=Kluyveromyces dobzhanskii CBS 2104 TaxID=1427455 RepID=A0A0A8L2C8_9SACH|nr:unnamed protein product [Kluyveromyces dobzhanskii CBS 2104]